MEKLTDKLIPAYPLTTSLSGGIKYNDTTTFTCYSVHMRLSKEYYTYYTKQYLNVQVMTDRK